MNNSVYEKYLYLAKGDTEEEKIINILSKSYEWKELFYELNEEDKEKYFVYIDGDNNKLEYLKTKNVDFIINYIKENNEFSDNIYYLYRLIELIDDIEKIILLIDFLPRDFYEYYRFSDFIGKYQKLEFIEAAIKFEINEYYLFRGLSAINDDNAKTKFFDKLCLGIQTDLIQNFSDLELKKKYAMLPVYTNYRSSLIASIDDDDFILEAFDNINNLKFRCNLISKIGKEDLRIKLIQKIENKDLKEFFLKENAPYEILDKKFNDIDSNITVGVELETCHQDIEDFFAAKRIYNDFIIKKDSSVKSGFEITSPIMHYNSEDMSKLYAVCELLKECNFYTNSSCGGHIHIGSNYFENVDDYKMLLYIYCNCENIFYLISNRINSKARNTVDRYAKKIKRNYLKANGNGIFERDTEDLEEFILLIKEINGNRYHGLNLVNLNRSKNTFEFRMPNGEIDFNELIPNIRLFAKLIEKSKELSNIEKADERNELLEQLISSAKERDKLLVLMNLLFSNEEDKKFYIERYDSNKRTIDKLFSYIKVEQPLDIINKKNKTLKKTLF